MLAVVVEPEGEKIALDPKVMHELHNAGIGEPMASHLATLPHITPEYIRAHVLLAKEDKIPTKLLIHRMRSADPAPRLNKHGHLENCTCEECQLYKYGEGKYAYLSEKGEINA